METKGYVNWGKPTCLHCGIARTPEGHDGCIGTLDNVANACCGHGEDQTAYVQFFYSDYDNDPNKFRLEGKEALEYICKNKQA